MGAIGIAVFVAAVLSLAAAIALWRKFNAPNADRVALALSLRDTATFAAAALGAPAKVDGRVAVGSTLPLSGPISGMEAVWFEVEVTEDQGGESFSHRFMVEESVPFRVGEVDVVPEGKLPAGVTTRSTGPVVEASPAMHAFLAKHGRSLASADGFVRRRDFIERSLTQGTPVVITGTKRAARIKSDGEGYRDGALTTEAELVMDWIYVGDEAEIERRGKRDPFGTGDAVFIGIAFVVIGSIVGAVLVGITAALVGS